MKKSQVNVWKVQPKIWQRRPVEQSAAYVAAHGLWQKSRNRRPSCAYRGERNPERAFRLAMHDVVNMDVPMASDIKDACSSAIAIATAFRLDVSFDFNGHDMVARKGMTADGMYDHYKELCRLSQEAYERSPAGIERRRREREQEALERAADIKKYGETMERLDSLDFDDFSAVIDWLCDYKSVCHVTGDRTLSDVAGVLMSHGFEPDVYTGDKMVPEDREVVARWLIGQGVNFLLAGCAPHQVFDHFVREWHAKFDSDRLEVA